MRGPPRPGLGAAPGGRGGAVRRCGRLEEGWSAAKHELTADEEDRCVPLARLARLARLHRLLRLAQLGRAQVRWR